MKQIAETDWDEMGASVDICTLPHSADDLKKRCGVQFIKYEEPGIGEMCAAVLSVDDVKFRVYSPVLEEHQNLVVQVLSHEADSLLALNTFVGFLGLEKNQLKWIADELGPARWVLTRLDDNDNEVEMFRFQTEASANWVRNKYEERGHKQSYYVRKLK